MFSTAVNPMCARQDLEEVEYDLDQPRIDRTVLITTQYIGAILSLLRERDCDSVKLDRMQLLFQTHYQRFVSIKWFA